jgi:hypothetical protein
MKKIKKPYYIIVSLIFAILSTSQPLYSQALLGGLLQFAKNNSLDDITIHYCGKIIETQRHELSIPKITYEIPCSSQQKNFFILVTPTSPTCVLKQFPDELDQQNTVDYLKIDPQSDYLLYFIELEKDDKTFAEGEILTYHWKISPTHLPESGQLPDTTIIVTYFPCFIKAIKGGNHLELPTLYIDNSVTENFGSLEDFKDALIKMQLSAPDLNVLHAPSKHITKVTAESRRVLKIETLA